MRVTRHPLPEHLAYWLPLGSTAEGSCGGSVPITASLTPRLAPWMEEAFRYGPATARADRTGHLQGALGPRTPRNCVQLFAWTLSWLLAFLG